MSALIVVAYPDKQQGDAFFTKLAQAQKEKIFDLEKAVLVTKENEQDITIHWDNALETQTDKLHVFWKLFVNNLLLYPMRFLNNSYNEKYILAMDSVGIPQSVIEEIEHKLAVGSSATFILIQENYLQTALNYLSDCGGKILSGSLWHTNEDMFQSALET